MDFKDVLLASQTYQSRSIGANGQRLVNMYYEPNPEGSEFPFTLYSRPCLQEWLDLGTDKPVQGITVFNGYLYAVSNDRLYRIDTDKNVTDSALIVTGGNLCQFDATSIELGILTDIAGFYTVSTINAVSNRTLLLTANGVLPRSLTAFDEYFLVSDGQSFYGSNPLNSGVWDPLFYFTANEKGDDLVQIMGFNNSLWAFGTDTYQVFYNTGGDNNSVEEQTFQNIDGSSNTTRGCASKFSIVKEDNRLFFLGNDGVFYTMQGYSPQKISTPAIDYAISKFSIFTDCESFVCNVAGNKFIVNNFPDAEKTFVYHINYDKWYEWGMSESDLFAGKCYAFFDNKALIGDRSNGKIYTLSLEQFTDDGEIVPRVIDLPPIYSDGNWIFHEEMRIGVDTGYVPASGQGSNPYLAVSYSDTRGASFGAERLLPLGQRGDYAKTIRTHSLGRSRHRIYRLRYTEPTSFTITSLGGRGQVGSYG